MMRKILTSYLTVATVSLTAPSAFADVSFCNETGRQLKFAIASPVKVPVNTNQISGWYFVKDGSCRMMLRGDYSGIEIYYAAKYMDDSEYVSTESSEVYPFFVSNRPFSRRGTYSTLQNTSRAGWEQQNFYQMTPNSGDMTYYFGD